MKKPINKIIYFDKETIRNILQEQNKGSKTSQKAFTTSIEAGTEITGEAKIKLAVPFTERLSFMLSGKLSASYIIKRDSETTITSTEISEFENLKNRLTEIKNIIIYDIENSSTFFRVAGGYLRIMKGGVDGVDTKEFNVVMDGYDGYDTYKVDNHRYVRFNNSAFVSNYKRNDLLATKMTLYCVEVGKFDKGKFDFLEQLNKMENLLKGVNQQTYLADTFPLKESEETRDDVKIETNPGTPRPDILLYDVVYACIENGGINDQ